MVKRPPWGRDHNISTTAQRFDLRRITDPADNNRLSVIHVFAIATNRFGDLIGQLPCW